MTDEEIEKLAEKLAQKQKEEYIKSRRQHNTIAEITRKYHERIWDKFGATGTIESAIRTVAIYKAGERYISRLNDEQLVECQEYAEKLFKDLLGE